MSIRLNFCRSVPPEFLRSFFCYFSLLCICVMTLPVLCLVKGKTNASAVSSRSNTAPYVRPQSSQSQHLDAFAHISIQFDRTFCPEIRCCAAVLYSRTLKCLRIGQKTKRHMYVGRMSGCKQANQHPVKYPFALTNEIYLKEDSSGII